MDKRDWTYARRRAVSVGLSLLAMGVLFGCDGSSERNVILDTAPFFATTIPFRPDRTDAVVEFVRAFSKQHQMDFLLARQSLGPGEFNASADGPSLNLKALRVSAIDGDKVQVFAIARGAPTANDKALVEEFVAQIRQREGAVS
jgi:hypothetical protein